MQKNLIGLLLIVIICIFTCTPKLHKYLQIRKNEPVVYMQDMAEIFKVSCRHCHTEKGINDYGKKMKKKMQISLELGLTCASCHIEGGGNLSPLGEVGKVMFDVSRDASVECRFCHKGRKEYSRKGEISKYMFAYSFRERERCVSCHKQGKRFKLNERGKLAKEQKVIKIKE